MRDLATSADIDALVSAGVEEDRELDYKQAIPDARKLAAEVVAFANTIGGNIVVGVPEERDAEGNKTGRPLPAAGVAIQRSAHDEELRLQQVIESHVLPKPFGVTVKAVDGGYADGPVFVIRVPRSWAGPHMVGPASNQFYIRGTNRKSPMSVDDIRRAFFQSADMGERAHSYRDSRLVRISQTTPICKSPAVVLRVVPANAVEGSATVDVRTADQDGVRGLLRPLGTDPQDAHFGYNAGGFIAQFPGDDRLLGYGQLFRSGAVEHVDTWHCFQVGEQVVLGTILESGLCEATERCMKLYTVLDVPPPFHILISLLKCWAKAVDVHPQRGMRRHQEPSPIGEPELRLPSVVVTDTNADIVVALRPAFDALWQASGWPGSQRT